MAVTFIVGGADTDGANSYASVADYLAINREVGVDGADLTALEETVIERHLMSATRFVDQHHWLGMPKHEDNMPRLGLPRDSMVVGCGNTHYREGYLLPNDEIPWVVVHAVCLLAEEERASGKTLWRPSRDRAQVTSSKRSIVGSSKVFADPLSPRRYPAIEKLLAGLTRPTGSTVELTVL